MSGGVNVDTSAEGSEAVVAEEYKDKDKKAPENCVPNVVITCSADDDIDAAIDAVQMIHSFSFPTADEVLFPEYIHSVYCDTGMDSNVRPLMSWVVRDERWGQRVIVPYIISASSSLHCFDTVSWELHLSYKKKKTGNSQKFKKV